MKTVNFGLIGLGPRGETLLATLFELLNKDIRVSAICDLKPERRQRICEIMRGKGYPLPAVYSDYRELIRSNDVDAVLIPTSWNSHLQIAGEAMSCGKYAGIEVGGAANMDELWRLVRASESTGVSCMMLENCCYGRNEMLCLNLLKKGLFGELVHCACGYEHALGEEWAKCRRFGSERDMHNRFRCGDLYPTHGIGPVAKLLKINRGNRFLSLTSTASKATGFARWAAEAGVPNEYREADIVTTVIKCANGETVTVTHGISLSRPYSRDLRVQGTRGIFLEDVHGVYLEGISPVTEKLDVAGNPYLAHEWTPVESIYEKYDHPVWQKFRKNILGGHGGMDALTLQAFAEAVRNRTAPPIDVYDCAAWMAVTALSEQSIALGSMPVAFPDFTDGRWIEPVQESGSQWSLD